MLKKQPTYDIKIKLSNIRELFNNLDPSPFLERDLDPDAAEYFTDSVKEHFLKRKMRIIVYLPNNQLTKISEKSIKKAISNYYDYMIGFVKRKFNNLMRDGRNALITGIVFLAVCLGFSDFFTSNFTGFLSTVLGEGLLVAGWVGMWRPITIFLYEWWPLAREARIYLKIRNMDVVVKPIEKTS